MPFDSLTGVQTKVAIVEDDARIREELAKLFDRSEGFECLGTYADGETALAEIPRATPDVVLMDINLPGMSGVEAVKRLKLPDGFKATLFACDPLIEYPSAMCIGPELLAMTSRERAITATSSGMLVSPTSE